MTKTVNNGITTTSYKVYNLRILTYMIDFSCKISYLSTDSLGTAWICCTAEISIIVA